MSRARQRGFSIVELMVAMAISLILLAGVLAVVYSSKVAYRQNERVARLQEGGRAAVELMLQDMRAGGFHGCTRTVPFTNTLTGSTDLLWNFAAPVQGYESTGAGSWSPTPDAIIVSPRDGSDIVAVRTVRPGRPLMTTNAGMSTTTADITVTKNSTDTLPNGTPVMISDCSAAAVFGVSTFTDAGTTATLVHTAGGAVSGVGPGNDSADVGVQFKTGAQVVPVDTVIYYIRDSATVRNGVTNPSLWRIVGSDAPQELIEGIEVMQMLYGQDTDGDRLVNSYVTADAVTNWSNVISVSFAMLIRSVEPNSPELDTRTYTLLPGTTAGPFNDHYERTLYTTTVTLRNTTT
jgi:type IV pilus assembly protein PilW